MDSLRASLLWLLATLALALGVGSAAYAEVPVRTCIAPVAEAASEAERLIALPTRFDCNAPQVRFGPGDFAVRLEFKPVRNDPADPLVLRTTSVWQEGARFIFRYADGTSDSIAYNSADASRYLTIGALFQLPVPLHAAPLTAIHVEVNDSANLRGVLLGARLMTRSEAFRIEGWLIALYAGFGGLSLALVAYNLALFAVQRHRFQLHYCAMVAALGGYTFTSSAAVLLVLPWLDNNDRMRANYALLALSAITAVSFVRSFFGTDLFGPRLRAYVNFATCCGVVSTLAFVSLAPWHGRLLDQAYFLSGALMLGTMVPVFWLAWRKQNRYLPLFLLAWSAPIGMSFLRLAHGFNLIPYSFWLDNGNMIALIIESLLSTMLIVARLRELSSERDSARASEQSALRLAGSDPLTGLLNRRAFMELAVGRTGRFRLMLIDIDHFKAINDRVGHDTGDEVLRCLAETIQALRPQGSLVVRMGGEEFALLVPLQFEADCRPARMLDAVREQDMPLGLTVTVSIGVAEGPVATEQDWRRLYRLADTALYRAKADGRDRACRATDFANTAAA